MIEAEAHGQKLTSEFLDDLFVSIRDKIPFDNWVEIKKNYDQVIAGLKHIIDNRCYNSDFEIVFNSEYTYFKKRELDKVHRKVYEGKYISNFPQSFWEEQDAIKARQEKESIERAEMREKSKKQKRVRRR